MTTGKKSSGKAKKKSTAPTGRRPSGPRAKAVAEQWIEENALRVGAAASVPTLIPGTHTALTTALEAYMIISIGRIYGRRLTPGEAVALIPTLGAGIVVGKTASSIAGEVLGWVPLVGWAAKGAASGATAYGIGKAAITYFETEHPQAPAADFEMLSLKKFITDFLANPTNLKDAGRVKITAVPEEEEDEDEEEEEDDEDEEEEDPEA